MFKVAIQKVFDKPLYFQQVVVVDSLCEAELMALKLAAKQFNTITVMLVHTGNLFYDIYQVGEPIGRIQIKSV